MAAGDMYDLAAEYLDACNAALIEAPGGPIDRAFVSLGLPAFDCCPQLTVHVPGPSLADTLPTSPALSAGQRPRLSSLILVPMVATVIRCVTVLQDLKTPPPAAALDADAEQSYADAWVIINHVRTQHEAGLLFPGECRELFQDPVTPVRTEGGCGGFEIPIRVQLDGYRPGGSS